MSMRDYPVDDYGLVLGSELAKQLAAKVGEYDADDDPDEEPWYLGEALEELGFERISDFSGEVIPLDGHGSYSWGDTEYYNDHIYYLRASKYPSLFQQAYKDIHDMAEEFRGRLANYLPANFNYESHLFHITGTVFG